MNDGAPARRLQRADATGGAALLAVAVFAAWGARDLAFGTIARPGPGFFPLGLAAILAALAAWILSRSLRPATGEAWTLWPDAQSRTRVLTMATALFGYILLIDTTGFIVSTFLLFLVMLRGVAARGWALSLLYSLAVAGTAWLFFARLLRVNLPVGVLF